MNDINCFPDSPCAGECYGICPEGFTCVKATEGNICVQLNKEQNRILIIAGWIAIVIIFIFGTLVAWNRGKKRDNFFTKAGAVLGYLSFPLTK